MGARERRGAAHSLKPFGIRVRADLGGRLLRRYKRFLADVETDTGEKLTVHCPDPGSLRGTARPGVRVRCSTSDNPKRKLRHTLEMIRNGRIWVGVHPGRANDVAARALSAGALAELSGYAVHEREVVACPGSRLDFRLSGHSDDPRDAWVEVKSVSMADGDTARFPDSVTARGRKHLETLLRLHQEGARAALVYLVQRADCDRVEAAEAIDPAYAAALRRAAQGGVEVFALGARITAREIRVERRLPVLL
ncbi:MAG: DNA/RNA nuclease SfsA [Myxococcota bacterium]|nr:DNA/RNA nuclease SfsA [Myxococcota bacterium]